MEKYGHLIYIKSYSNVAYLSVLPLIKAFHLHQFMRPRFILLAVNILNNKNLHRYNRICLKNNLSIASIWQINWIELSGSIMVDWFNCLFLFLLFLDFCYVVGLWTKMVILNWTNKKKLTIWAWAAHAPKNCNVLVVVDSLRNCTKLKILVRKIKQKAPATETVEFIRVYQT